MLFLGTIDDKTVEYPNGVCQGYSPSIEKILIPNILFNDKPIVLEEGFVLASKEALYPEKYNPILLPAIKCGLIKVISRDRDFIGYAKQRMKDQHLTPSPDTRLGKAYLLELQRACDNSERIYDGDAYLNYPPSKIDEYTYNRFVRMFETEDFSGLLDKSGVSLPKDYLKQYEKTYRYGNHGKQWTARAAWEDLSLRLLSESPHLTHFMMIKANRERQIIRAAATALENNVDFWVETGFDPSPHDLVDINSDDSMKPKDVERYPVPRVSIDDINKNSERLFKYISSPTTNLNWSRKAYLSQIRKSDRELNLNEIGLAAQRYEDDILSALQSNPLEDGEGATYTELATGVALGAAAERLLRHQLSPVLEEERIKFKEGAGFPRNKNVLDRLISRRGILGALGGLAVVYGWGQLNSGVSPLVKTILRSERIRQEYDLQDAWVEILMQNNVSNQLLQINRNNAKDLITL